MTHSSPFPLLLGLQISLVNELFRFLLHPSKAPSHSSVLYSFSFFCSSSSLPVADVGTGVEEAVVTFEGIAILTPREMNITICLTSSVDPHLEHIKNEAGVDENDDEKPAKKDQIKEVAVAAAAAASSSKESKKKSRDGKDDGKKNKRNNYYPNALKRAMTGFFYFSLAERKGSLSSTFPIENQNNLVTMRTLKNHLDRTKSLPFVK
ncbi:hypothetical protein PVK06_031767 [Gossypium arboreum]|uniref:Uncharacterized protein n=1 Tax=Gossypium arboreum TaxID=29729 RepID=A0ABR0NS09_GOSAR|nr:hypothetical protein PVK06_031767 [Gossypium arboreum]